jgi:hypothetical protein
MDRGTYWKVFGLGLFFSLVVGVVGAAVLTWDLKNDIELASGRHQVVVKVSYAKSP